MRILITLLLVTELSSVFAQQMPRPQYGVVQYSHNEGSGTVIAGDARPLGQAIGAVRAEFGWIVDYEEPPHESPSDWIVTDFQSTFPVGPRTVASDEEKILNKIVSDYNQTANPGNYVVRKQINGRYVVTGNAIRDESGFKRAFSPILDTPISIPLETRSFKETLSVIAQALYAKTGTNIIPNFGQGFGSVTIGGDNIPARNFLIQTLTGMETTRKLVWRLNYDPGVQCYVPTILARCVAPYYVLTVLPYRTAEGGGGGGFR